ncbi:hypothetical protein Rs2_35391 [Raphanus sativus]|nr:hypothetical protein Rs2_35391 [Raphanus sativus]
MSALEGIKLIKPTTEVFHSAEVDEWENGRGLKSGSDTITKGDVQISHSRFSPLQGIDEEEEENLEGNGKEVEKGEILENKTEGVSGQGVQTSTRGRKPAAVKKQVRGKIVRTKDLIFGGKQGTSKKASNRKQ